MICYWASHFSCNLACFQIEKHRLLWVSGLFLSTTKSQFTAVKGKSAKRKEKKPNQELANQVMNSLLLAILLASIIFTSLFTIGFNHDLIMEPVS